MVKPSGAPSSDGSSEKDVHYLPAIYPDSSLTPAENAARMMERNHELWVNTYEMFYQEKLKL